MALLDDVVERLSFIGNLLITPEGVRQIILPVYKDGKSADDLEALPYIQIEQRVTEREGDALVVWNTHALVCLASTTENIHVMLPTEYENGNHIDRSRYSSLSSFVKLAIIPPAGVRVRDILEEGNNLSMSLRNGKTSGYALAIQHGFYDQPKGMIQALADVLGIARSTYQEHLQSAEHAVLKWATTLVAFATQTFDEGGNLASSWTRPSDWPVASKRTRRLDSYRPRSLGLSQSGTGRPHGLIRALVDAGVNAIVAQKGVKVNMHTFATEAKRAWLCTILYPHAMLAHNQTTKSWLDMLMKHFREGASASQVRSTWAATTNP